MTNTTSAVLPPVVDAGAVSDRTPDGWRSETLEIDTQGSHLRE